jgi:hypothetical protein
MPVKHLQLLLFICIITTACKQQKTKNMAEVVNLLTLKQTDFAPTLENTIPSDKNLIYAPSLLFAWDRVKKMFNVPLTVSSMGTTDIRLLNQSLSYKNSLTEDEYEAKASLSGGVIVAEAFFNKALPFSKTLQPVNNGILFSNVQVKAFGMSTPDFGTTEFTRVLFYKDDDNFILQITPKDTTSQIILVKGLKQVETFADAMQQVGVLTAQGETESSDNKTAWRYKFYDDDSFAVPAIKFNIETNYKTLEGQAIIVGGDKQTIQTAYQRTAFSLDENGAVVESTAASAADSIAAPEHPKKMIFDKPFFIIIKHTNQVNPYFVMKVANAELMKKQ